MILKSKIGPDIFTLILYALLVFFGVLNIYSADYSTTTPSFFESFSASPKPRYFTEFMFVCIAIVIGIVIFILDYRFYPFMAYPLYVLLLGLLVGVLLFGVEIHGARSWFRIGSIQLQPAEFAKITTCLVLAKFMGRLGFSFNKKTDLLISIILVALPIILVILQNDVGSAIVYFSFIIVFYREGFSSLFLLLVLLISFLAILTIVIGKLAILFFIVLFSVITFHYIQKNKKHTLIALGILISSLILMFGLQYFFVNNLSDYQVILFGLIPVILSFIIYLFYKKIRFGFVLLISLIIAITYTASTDYFFNNFLQPHQQERINQVLGLAKESYNVRQSKIAIGSGELFGKGYLKGTQTKLKLVPEQETDFIFCTVGEEWGFFGSLIVILLFITFILRIIFIAERQRSYFSRVYAYGVAGIFFFHFFINVGMVIGLFPVVGIPLPFFSYGGSSLLSFSILLFLLIKLDMNRQEIIG